MRVDGVVVPDDLAAVVAAALGEYERRHVVADGGALARLRLELEDVYRARLPTVAERSTATVTTAHAAAVLGISERAVRARCVAGHLDATKEFGRWLIPRSVVETIGSRSPNGSNVRSTTP